MMSRRLIWGDTFAIVDEQIEAAKEFIVDEYPDKIGDDDFAYQMALDDISFQLKCQQDNLHVPVNQILIIADFGLWHGRCSGFKIESPEYLGELIGSMGIRGSYESEYYVEDGDLVCRLVHHDGANYYRFREVKTDDAAQEWLSNLNYGDISLTQEGISAHTVSLAPKIEKVYGWADNFAA